MKVQWRRVGIERIVGKDGTTEATIPAARHAKYMAMMPSIGELPPAGTRFLRRYWDAQNQVQWALLPAEQPPAAAMAGPPPAVLPPAAPAAPAAAAPHQTRTAAERKVAALLERLVQESHCSAEAARFVLCRQNDLSGAIERGEQYTGVAMAQNATAKHYAADDAHIRWSTGTVPTYVLADRGLLVCKLHRRDFFLTDRAIGPANDESDVEEDDVKVGDGFNAILFDFLFDEKLLGAKPVLMLFGTWAWAWKDPSERFEISVKAYHPSPRSYVPVVRKHISIFHAAFVVAEHLKRVGKNEFLVLLRQMLEAMDSTNLDYLSIDAILDAIKQNMNAVGFDFMASGAWRKLLDADILWSIAHRVRDPFNHDPDVQSARMNEFHTRLVANGEMQEHLKDCAREIMEAKGLKFDAANFVQCKMCPHRRYGAAGTTPRKIPLHRNPDTWEMCGIDGKAALETHSAKTPAALLRELEETYEANGTFDDEKVYALVAGFSGRHQWKVYRSELESAKVAIQIYGVKMPSYRSEHEVPNRPKRDEALPAMCEMLYSTERRAVVGCRHCDMELVAMSRSHHEKKCVRRPAAAQPTRLPCGECRVCTSSLGPIDPEECRWTCKVTHGARSAPRETWCAQCAKNQNFRKCLVRRRLLESSEADAPVPDAAATMPTDE